MSHQSRHSRRGSRPFAALAAAALSASLAPGAGTAVHAAGSIALSVATLPYNYTAPDTIAVTGTGTDFVQGGSVVYILQNGANM